MKPAILLTTLLIFAPPARADNMMTVQGAGNRSCGSWTQARREHGMLAAVFESWVAGFLTGSNSIIAEQFNVSPLEEAHGDAQGLWGWMDNYCQTHPLDAVATAAAKLSGELNVRTMGRVPPHSSK